MTDENLFQQVVALIKELRNTRDVESNWPLLKHLVESNVEQIAEVFSSRWLISICDTYADFGSAVEKRNAFIISLLVNMIRVSDTIRYLYENPKNPDRVRELKNSQVPLYDGLVTLHLDRQDTCLNLSKRIIRLLTETPVLLRIYETVIDRALRSASLLSEFAALSQMPERVFPINALEMPDNYGVI